MSFGSHIPFQCAYTYMSICLLPFFYFNNSKSCNFLPSSSSVANFNTSSCKPSTQSTLKYAPNAIPVSPFSMRSEEHTSELQSREKLVCRLLLEKKNEKKNADPILHQ